jgi:hypothetical protein
MSWNRRLLYIWLIASLVWIVFAFLYAITPELDDMAWGVGDIAECIAILLGLPVAGLGAGIAILWIVRDSES